ncbi:MAG: hypothetical protein ACFFD2_01350 [Promethearchaeota archaeon]
MSSFEVIARYNEYSNELININPNIRINGVKHLARLYWDAPELKISIVAKLEQGVADSDENVARIAKQMLELIKSGRKYRSYYTPYKPTSTSTSTGPITEGPSQNIKNIVINVICCIVFIIIYILIYGYM